jgi:predicted RNA-binding protein associated with RNAse of E/G family
MSTVEFELTDELFQAATALGLLTSEAFAKRIQDAIAVHKLEQNPASGMWRDREDMKDVAAYIRSIRAPRFNRDGSRRK